MGILVLITGSIGCVSIISEIIVVGVGKGCIGKTISGVIGAIVSITISGVIGAIVSIGGVGTGSADTTRAGAGSMVVVGFKDLGSLTPLKSIGW